MGLNSQGFPAVSELTPFWGRFLRVWLARLFEWQSAKGFSNQACPDVERLRWPLRQGLQYSSKAGSSRKHDP